MAVSSQGNWLKCCRSGSFPYLLQQELMVDGARLAEAPMAAHAGIQEAQPVCRRKGYALRNIEPCMMS
jgi:hypothetical protein